MDFNKIVPVTGLFLVMLLVGLAFTGYAQTNTAEKQGVASFAEDTKEEPRLISVSGTAKKTMAPDTAEIYLSVETLDKSASKSQNQNAVISEKVRKALKDSGIADKDIQTTSYNLYQEYEWNQSTLKSEVKGYKTVNSIKVIVRNLSNVGTTIDVAVGVGANSVSGVSFTLSDEKQAQLANEALQQAAANASLKAQNIAKGLGIALGKVQTASESSSYYPPTPYYRSYDLAAGATAESAKTSITPGDIEVNASVSVTYEIV